MSGSFTRLPGFDYVPVRGHACPRVDLSRLAVLDDPRILCPHNAWQPLPAARVPHAPMWHVRTDRKAGLSLLPLWSRRCAGVGSQCAGTQDEPAHVARAGGARGRVPEYAVLSIRHALILESGLVLNATHRFNLAQSYRELALPWQRDGFGLTGDAPAATPCSQFKLRHRRLVYSFRQLYAGNPWHMMVQVLPLLAPVLAQIRASNDATLLVSSPLLKLLAHQWLPAERVLFTAAPVSAEEVRLVVGRPPFSPLFHEHPTGCLAALRPLPPPQPGKMSLLFLARQPLSSAAARAWHATSARAFDEGLVLARTRELLQRRGAALQLVAFEFTTLLEQQQAFASAAIVVGSHGTGWSGLVFARPAVVLIEWAFLRDSWTLAEYLGLNATYFQLLPHWIDNPHVLPCNESRMMDDCPWRLDEGDLRTYDLLLDQILVAQQGSMTASRLVQELPDNVMSRIALSNHMARKSQRIISEADCEQVVQKSRIAS